MLRNGLDGETMSDLAKEQTQQSAPAQTSEALPPEELPVRYMDDDTFQRCLVKVITVHDRLLSKLAE